MKIFSQKRLFAYLLAVCIILSSMWGVVFAQTNVFEQNFNDNLDGVTPASFKTVERPAEGVTEYTPYTPAPNDGKDGALLSNMENGSKVKIDFGGAKTGKIIFEGQFRLEGQEAKSSAIKFFDIYDDKNKCILMFTIGNSDANGFDVRPVHRSVDGAAQTAPYPINGGRIPYKTWHTLRVEIDTEAGTMDVYVNGYQLVSGGYPWGYTAAGTKIPNIAYSTSYHSAAGHTIPFLIDEVRITQAESGYQITGDVGAGGMVYYDGALFADGASLSFDANTKPVFTIVPEDGYEVASLFLGETDYSSAIIDKKSGDTVTFPALERDTVLRVQFVKSETAGNPGFAEGGSSLFTEQEYTYTGNGKDYQGYSIIVFTTLNNFVYTAGAECGVEFYDPDSGVREQLPALFEPRPGGKFGIRIFGNVLSRQGAYELTPYVKNGDKLVYGDTIYMNREI